MSSISHLCVDMDVDSPSSSIVNGSGSLKRCSSAPMINENCHMSTTPAGSNQREQPFNLFGNNNSANQTRTRKLSASFSPISGSPVSGLRLAPRINQLRQEDYADASNTREMAHEREIHSAMQISQSWEDLSLMNDSSSSTTTTTATTTTTTTTTPTSTNNNGTTQRLNSKTTPLHVDLNNNHQNSLLFQNNSIFSNNSNSYGSNTNSPSPTRYSPCSSSNSSSSYSMSFQSPTRSFGSGTTAMCLVGGVSGCGSGSGGGVAASRTFIRRSASPVLRPSPLGGVKRKLGELILSNTGGNECGGSGGGTNGGGGKRFAVGNAKNGGLLRIGGMNSPSSTPTPQPSSLGERRVGSNDGVRRGGGLSDEVDGSNFNFTFKLDNGSIVLSKETFSKNNHGTNGNGGSVTMTAAAVTSSPSSLSKSNERMNESSS